MLLAAKGVPSEGPEKALAARLDDRTQRRARRCRGTNGRQAGAARTAGRCGDVRRRRRRGPRLDRPPPSPLQSPCFGRPLVLCRGAPSPAGRPVSAHLVQHALKVLRVKRRLLRRCQLDLEQLLLAAGSVHGLCQRAVDLRRARQVGAAGGVGWNARWVLPAGPLTGRAGMLGRVYARAGGRAGTERAGCRGARAHQDLLPRGPARRAGCWTVDTFPSHLHHTVRPICIPGHSPPTRSWAWSSPGQAGRRPAAACLVQHGAKLASLSICLLPIRTKGRILHTSRGDGRRVSVRARGGGKLKLPGPCWGPYLSAWCWGVDAARHGTRAHAPGTRTRASCSRHRRHYHQGSSAGGSGGAALPDRTSQEPSRRCI